MSIDNQKVIDKVRKLLNMTGENGATDAEIQNAMDRAQKLMHEHHLSEADLNHEPVDDYKKVDEAEYSTFRTFVGGAFYKWEMDLASFVQEFVGCPCYLDNNKKLAKKNGIVLTYEWGGKEYTWNGKSIVFYGIAEDAAIAANLYEEMRKLISTMAMAKWGKVYKGDGAAYSEGFVMGLFSTMRKARESEKSQAKLSNSSTGLVLVARRDDLVKYKKTKADNWLKEAKGIELKKPSAGNWGAYDNQSSARSEGFSDGKATNVSAARSKKIGG